MQQTHEISWVQQTHETSSAISILPWLIVIGQQEQCSKHMKPRVQLIVIGQQEQCSKHMKPRVQYQSYPG